MVKYCKVFGSLVTIVLILCGCKAHVASDVSNERVSHKRLQMPPDGGYPVESVRGLKPGRSTMTDVLSVFGQPTERTRTGNLVYKSSKGDILYLFVFYNVYTNGENDTLGVIGIRDPDFKLSTGIGINSTEEDLFSVYGKKKLGKARTYAKSRIFPPKDPTTLTQSLAYANHSKIYFELWHDGAEGRKRIAHIAISDDPDRRKGTTSTKSK